MKLKWKQVERIYYENDNNNLYWKYMKTMDECSSVIKAKGVDWAW